MKTAPLAAVLLLACGGAALPPPETPSEPQAVAELDPRIAALDFVEGGEEEAMEAARAIARGGVHAEDRAAATAALVEANGRLEGEDGLQNRMRITFIDALHALAAAGDPEAPRALGAMVLDPAPHFLLRRHAASRLATLGHAGSVDVFVQGLLLFPEGQPVHRMNDISMAALVTIGRPALAPLLAMLAGEDERALAMANAYIGAVREVAPQVGDQLEPTLLIASEVVLTLGAMGLDEARPALLEQASLEELGQRVPAVLALVHLSPRGEALEQTRAALVRVFAELPDNRAGLMSRSRLIAAGLHLYDPELIDFFVGVVEDQEQPDLRLMAFGAACMLASGPQGARLRALLDAQPTTDQGGLREAFARYEPVLAAIERCGDDACWLGLLADSDALMARKAAAMLGRSGELTPAIEEALVLALGNSSMEVRLAAVGALDRLAVSGSEATIARIDELEEQETGQAIWTHFANEALVVRARLRLRAR